MRFSFAKTGRLAAVLGASGLVTGASGVAAAVAKGAFGPLAFPLVLGSGLLWLGRSVGETFVEIGDDDVHVKMGALFDQRIPLSAIASVEEGRWSLLGGLGVRSNLRGTVAITTIAGQVAELTLDPPQRLPLLVGLGAVKTTKLVLSPEDLAGFLTALRERLDT